jgi:aminoacrylate peracid reductase
MTREIITPAGSPPPLAPYSPAIKVGHTVYVSGVLAMDRDGKSVGIGDVKVQTRQVLETIQAILQAAGGTLADIAFNAIFLKNLDDYAEMNSVYAEFFPKAPPARYCIQANLVKPEFLVEIAATAHLQAG